MLRDYDESRSREDWKVAEEVKNDLCRAPFASVFVRFISIASGPYAARIIQDSRSLAILEKYPEIKSWL